MVGVITGQQIYRDMAYGGASQITGKVMNGPSPAQFKVQLFDRVSGFLVRETWSSEIGEYSFTWLAYKSEGYTIICFNHIDSTVAVFSYQTPSAM